MTFIQHALAAGVVVALSASGGMSAYDHQLDKRSQTATDSITSVETARTNSEKSASDEALYARFTATKEKAASALASVNKMEQTSKDAQGHLYSGDSFDTNTSSSILTIASSYVSNDYDDYVISMKALDAVSANADDTTSKINESVEKEKARIAEEERIAAEKAAEAARAAAEAATKSSSSYSSRSSSSGSSSSGTSRTSSGTSSASSSSGTSGSGSTSAATYTLNVSGYCGESSCVQSVVDNNPVAYIDYAGWGLSEIAGHNYGAAGIIANFQPGQTVRVYGTGAGLYQITSVVWTFKGASVTDVPSGFAFQTCVGSKMKLAYATKIG